MIAHGFSHGYTADHLREALKGAIQLSSETSLTHARFGAQPVPTRGGQESLVSPLPRLIVFRRFSLKPWAIMFGPSGVMPVVGPHPSLARSHLANVEAPQTGAIVGLHPAAQPIHTIPIATS